MANSKFERRYWGETAWGKIFVAVAGGAILMLLGWLGGLFTHSPSSPVVTVTAPDDPVSAGLPFSLAASATGAPVSAWRWHLEGEPTETSRIGHCTPRGDASTLVCLLSAPGSVVVSATAEMETGLIGQANASVAVELADWFIGLLFLPGVPALRSPGLACSSGCSSDFS